jgi:hypothetical protein
MFAACVTLVSPLLPSGVRFAVSRLSSNFVRSVRGAVPTLISIAGFQELTQFLRLRTMTYRKERRTSGSRVHRADEFRFSVGGGSRVRSGFQPNGHPRTRRVHDRHPTTGILSASWTARNRASITPRAHRLAILRGDAQVAQLVEHVTENHGVGGSIPPLGTILK